MAPTPTAENHNVSQAKEDFAWLLGSDLRPWALAYLDVEMLNALYLQLPGERDVRIMLPGAALDASDRAKSEIAKYFKDNIGLAEVARTRQREALSAWLADTAQKKMRLPSDPWVTYQFHREALETIAGYKAKVQRQSLPNLTRMAADIKQAVEQITGVMNATGGHEQKMQWYNLLLQLKEGFTLFQSQVVASDRQLLDVIERYEQDNPPQARPPGQPPQGTRGEAARNLQTTGTPALTSDSVQREKAQPVQKPEAPSSTGGWIVILGMVATVVGLFYKMRRRVAGKPGAAETPTS